MTHRKKLVVGGGRAPGFPEHDDETATVNPDPSALPDVVGTLASAELPADTFDHVLIERVPSWTIDTAMIDHIGRVPRPGGTFELGTGRDAILGGVFNGAVAGSAIARLAAHGYESISAPPSLGWHLTAKMTDSPAQTHEEREAHVLQELERVHNEAASNAEEGLRTSRSRRYSGGVPDAETLRQRGHAADERAHQAQLAMGVQDAFRIVAGIDLEDMVPVILEDHGRLVHSERIAQPYRRHAAIHEAQTALQEATDCFAAGDLDRARASLSCVNRLLERNWPAPGPLQERAARIDAEYEELRLKLG